MYARIALVWLGALFAGGVPAASAASSCPLLDACAIGAGFDEDFVTVEGSASFDVVSIDGEPGSRERLGGVPYAYRIGRYEVTNCQYAAFLNAVAARDGADADALPDDPHSLYFVKAGDDRFEPMAASPHGGILWCDAARRAPGGACERAPACPDPDAPACYAVKRGFERRPVVFVSFFDAARFANWLDAGCAAGGESERGPYPFVDADGRALAPARRTDVVRACRGARYFVPSEDEWYKAAYQDPVSGRYYDFPTRSDVVACRRPHETSDAARPTLGAANCGFVASASGPGSDPLAADHPVIRAGPTPVGAYGAASASPHGTFDQAGNVVEWTDTKLRRTLGVSPPVDVSVRVIRGSAWDRFAKILMHRQWRSWVFAVERGVFGGEFDFLGFRIGARAGDIDPCPRDAGPT